VQFDAMGDSELRGAARLREARDLATVHNWDPHIMAVMESFS